MGLAVAQDAAKAPEPKPAEAKKEPAKTSTKPKDYFADDPRMGTADAPLLRAPIGQMAKPTKPFEVPENKEGEPPLSTTLNPRDYGTGSGKTYHDQKPPVKAEDEPIKKPEPPAGIQESTETAGTTPLWKVNKGDSPDPPAAKSFLMTEAETSAGCEPAIDVSQK